MSLLLRILRTALTSIVRHGIVNLTAVFVMTLLFFIFNALIFTGGTVGAALTTVNQQLDLTLNFVRPVDAFQATSIGNELRHAFPTIRTTTFISSDAAFQGFLTGFAAINPTLTHWLETNTGDSPLPATLIVAVDPAFHSAIIDYLSRSRYAKILDLQQSGSSDLAIRTAQKITSLDHILTQAGIGTGIAFALLATLIVIAIIRLTIMSRRDELTIMRLVGATSNYVRLPFVIEGGILTGLAGIVGCILFLCMLNATNFETLAGTLFGATGNLLDTARTAYVQQFSIIVGWQILAAILLGVCASTIATRRYLKIA